MPYCITLRSRTDAKTLGWYDGSNYRWSTDYTRQVLFQKKTDAKLICDELRSLCPRNAKVINIEPEQVGPSLDLAKRIAANGASRAAPSFMTTTTRSTGSVAKLVGSQRRTISAAASRQAPPRREVPVCTDAFLAAPNSDHAGEHRSRS